MNIRPDNFQKATINEIGMDLSFVDNVLSIIKEKIGIEGIPEDSDSVSNWCDSLYILIEYLQLHISCIRSAADSIYKNGLHG